MYTNKIVQMDIKANKSQFFIAKRKLDMANKYRACIQWWITTQRV